MDEPLSQDTREPAAPADRRATAPTPAVGNATRLLRSSGIWFRAVSLAGGIGLLFWLQCHYGLLDYFAPGRIESTIAAIRGSLDRFGFLGPVVFCGREFSGGRREHTAGAVGLYLRPIVRPHRRMPARIHHRRSRYVTRAPDRTEAGAPPRPAADERSHGVSPRQPPGTRPEKRDCAAAYLLHGPCTELDAGTFTPPLQDACSRHHRGSRAWNYCYRVAIPCRYQGHFLRPVDQSPPLPAALDSDRVGPLASGRSPGCGTVAPAPGESRHTVKTPSMNHRGVT